MEWKMHRSPTEMRKIMARNQEILRRERTRGRPILRSREVPPVEMKIPERMKANGVRAGSVRTRQQGRRGQKLDLTYIELRDLRHEALWPTDAACECDNCGMPIANSNGVVLKNCMTHQICMACITTAVFEDRRVCPVGNCMAPIRPSEMNALIDRMTSTPGLVPNPNLDPGSPSAGRFRVDSPEPMARKLDLDHLDDIRSSGTNIVPVNGFSKCSKCGEFCQKLEAFLLNGCQKHKICRSCASAACGQLGGRCPVDTCSSVLTQEEVNRGPHRINPRSGCYGCPEDGGGIFGFVQSRTGGTK